MNTAGGSEVDGVAAASELVVGGCQNLRQYCRVNAVAVQDMVVGGY